MKSTKEFFSYFDFPIYQTDPIYALSEKNTYYQIKACCSGMSVLKQRKHQRYSSEDLQLFQKAHSSSCSINKIVENNSLQEDFLTTIDSFIANLEKKLDNLENFFTLSNTSNSKYEESLVTNLYDTLLTIKNSVFSKSINLEKFNTILDEHYEGLLSTLNTSENLNFHEKLLTSLHFLDAKINQFNSLLEGKHILPSESSLPIPSAIDSIKLFEIKFHNYENALLHGSSRLLHYYELPFPWRENQFVINGYRFHNNHLKALKSICTCHNETSNIWTHLFGALTMMYISIWHFPHTELYAQNSSWDNAVLYLFFLASIKCLLSSTFWHTFNGTTSLYLRKKFSCIDYTGITVLITASIITTEYATLYYYPILQTTMICFSLFCGILGFFFNWSAYFDRPESKPFRVGFFVSLSALGASSFFFLAYEKGFIHSLKFYLPITRSLVWYLIGVMFYSTLIPEKFRTDIIADVDQPEEHELTSDKVVKNLHKYFKEDLKPASRSFASLWWTDYIFQSHNIWHVFVLLGVLGHYSAICEMFRNIPMNE